MAGLRDLEKRVAGYAATRTPSLAAGRVVLAASGGADSAAMVALLCESGVVSACAAVVAHFDHRLRGDAAAARDLAAVRALCDRYGLPLIAGAWDAPRAGEAAARAARYAYLREAALEEQAVAVVTGHTSDDQAETVVMHILRGAGLHGVAGMAPESRWPLAAGAGTPVLARPLLGVSREETRAYCEVLGLGYADDPSNEDRAYLRNRIRRDVLPAMERVRPDARRALVELAAEARESVAAMEALARPAVVSAVAGEVRLSREALRQMSPALAPYAYRLALVVLRGDARDMERRHYEMLRGVADAATGSMFELPRGVVVTVDPDAVALSIGAPWAPLVAPDFERALPFAGDAGAWSIQVTRADPAAPDEASWGALALPADAVVRGRRPGDRIAQRGMIGHKKLQDYYVDRKVPRRERDAAPVIACGAEVLWTPFGVAAAAAAGARYLVTARRREVVRTV
jgi:tRNA(Ile)-lysidine synthetase-like protein